jgi:tetratricopeptide (TPR) repeat protein
MGWFQRGRDKLVAYRRRSAYEKHPSAETLTQLIQCLLSMGDYAEAHRFSSLGVKTYIQNELIRELHRISTQQRAREGIEQARKEILTNPTRHSYLKLARDSLTLRDSETARKALEECVARYPDCAPAFIGLAQIHEKLFLWDLAAEDGHQVIRYANEARRLSPSEVEPVFHVAQFFARIGATTHARRTAERVLKLDRGHAGARTLIELLAKEPENAEEVDLNILLQQIEEKGRLPGDEVSERERIQREISRYRAGLPELRESLPGSRCTVLGPDGEAWEESGLVDHDALISLAHGLTSTTHLTTRRAGLGPMRAITLESDAGAVVMRRGFRGTVACLLPRGAPLRGSQQTLKRVMQSGSAESVGKDTL